MTNKLLATSVLLVVIRTSLLFSQNPPPQSMFARITSQSQVNGAWDDGQIRTMNQIRDAALHDPYAYDQLSYLSNNIGARLTGSPEAAAAVERVASELRSLGAEVTLEKTTVPHWVRGEESAALTTWKGMTPGTTQKIVVTALGSSPSTSPTGLTAPVVVIDSFDQLNTKPSGSLKGKIVLFNRPFDKELTAAGHPIDAYAQSAVYRAIGPSTASRLGAVAVIVRTVAGEDFRLPHTGLTVFEQDVTPIPAAAVTSEDADLIAILAQQGPVVMRLTLTPQNLPPREGYNVVADWKGSQHPEQVVLVSGHLDSWDLGTGALDDGAGVVIGMEAIQLMHELNLHPKRTIRFVAWMNEEQGATGAATYVADHAAEMTNHIAAIENDRGADHPFGIIFNGPGALAEYLAPIARTLDPIGANLVLNEEEIGEDVARIMAKGVPGICSAQDMRRYFNYHHSAADTLDKVVRRQLAENAAVTSVLAFALADAEEPAPRMR
jgi:carboxypeptidase Q